MQLYKTLLAATLLTLPTQLAHAAMSAQDFAQQATYASQFELSSSQMAVEKSKSTEVRLFAQKMITDHTQASNTLKATLPASTVNPGLIKDKPDDAHQDTLDDLRKASADDFDEDYLEAQDKAHKEAVSLFTSYAESGTDPALKKFAADTLPVLRSHQQHLSELDKQIED